MHEQTNDVVNQEFYDDITREQFEDPELESLIANGKRNYHAMPVKSSYLPERLTGYNFAIIHFIYIFI